MRQSALRMGLAVLLAALSMLAGCSTTVRPPVAELPDRSDLTLSKIVIPARIAGVVIYPPESAPEAAGVSPVSFEDSGEQPPIVVEFDHEGGRLDAETWRISGVTTDTVAFDESLDTMIYVQFARTSLGKAYMTAPDVVAAVRKARANRSEEAQRAETPMWDAIAFEGGGGIIDVEAGVVTGVTKKNDTVAVALGDVAYAEQKRRSLIKTIRFGAGLAGSLLFGLGISHTF